MMRQRRNAHHIQRRDAVRSLFLVSPFHCGESIQESFETRIEIELGAAVSSLDLRFLRLFAARRTAAAKRRRMRKDAG
jgi:hypothetical protein